jgi:hypothetical protein
VNQKQWIILGVIAVVLVLGLIFLSSTPSNNLPETGENEPMSGLGYCSEEGTKPCVVSFSVNAQDTMLINFLLPDLSFPAFYMKITRGGVEITYACQRVSTAPNNAYCAGPKLSPGEVLTLKLISTRDETLLAQGDLSIIGLAFPTMGIAVSTPQEAPTMLMVLPTPTALPLFVLPTQTETQPSYPNPSYPNPSYP